jgi:hypothetical protein
MAVVERLVRNSDNLIKLTLTEDGAAISGAWTSLEVHIGDTIVFTRSANGNGITLSVTTGVLTIDPADLSAPELTQLDTLVAGQFYKVRIVVYSASNDDGAVFCGPGSTLLMFHISDKP